MPNTFSVSMSPRFTSTTPITLSPFLIATDTPWFPYLTSWDFSTGHTISSTLLLSSYSLANYPSRTLRYYWTFTGTARHRSDVVTVYSKLKLLVAIFHTKLMLNTLVLNFLAALHFNRHKVRMLIISSGRVNTLWKLSPWLEVPLLVTALWLVARTCILVKFFLSKE